MLWSIQSTVRETWCVPPLCVPLHLPVRAPTTDGLTSAGRRGQGETAVVTTTGDASVLPNTVTSQIGTFDARSPAVERTVKRISEISFTPVAWGEPLRVLHYEPGQFFRGHLDVHAKPGRHTSSRIATCFMYLSDVEQGGETYFPLAKRADGGHDPAPSTCLGFEGKDVNAHSRTGQSRRVAAAYYDGSEFKQGRFSKEERQSLGVVIKPKKGRAVLWWNRKQDGDIDWRSRHVGCPLVRGEKWYVPSCFRPPSPSRRPNAQRVPIWLGLP
jgi:hypothetical protein